MSNSKNLFYLPLTLFICFLMRAQNIDSLVRSHTDEKGTVNVEKMLLAGRDLMYLKPDFSFVIAKKAVAISVKQKDVYQIAESYLSLGAAYTFYNVNLDSSDNYLRKAETAYLRSGSEKTKKGLGSVYHNLGTVHQIRGQYGKAIQDYITAEKYFNQAGEHKMKVYTQSNIATLYELAGNYKKGEKYAREALLNARKLKNEFMVGTSANNLVSVLLNLKKHPEIPKLLDEVKQYGEKHSDQYKTFLYHLQYGKYLHQVGKHPEKVLKEAETAVILAEKVGDDWEIMRTHNSLAEMYLDNKMYTQAANAAEKGRQIAEKISAKEHERNALWILAHTDAQKDDYKSAFTQMDRAYALKDSVLAENSRQQMEFLEAEFQNEKKELQISGMEKQKKLYWEIFALTALSFIILLRVLYQRNRAQKAKKELAESQVQQLEKEKSLIATRSVLEGEATERTRIARDLHDGLGGMLSAVKLNLFDIKKGNTILESTDVQRFNKVLDMLRLENQLEIMVYRSVHELVNNAIKYADAQQINVQIVQHPDSLLLTVQDDGSGFDPEASKKGTGLKNIRRRAESAEGSMSIDSKPGYGTEINVEFKVKPIENG